MFVRELAKKHNVNIDQILDLISRFGAFTTQHIKEGDWKIINYPHWGKYIPIAKRQFKENFDVNKRKLSYENNNNTGKQEEESNNNELQ